MKTMTRMMMAVPMAMTAMTDDDHVMKTQTTMNMQHEHEQQDENHESRKFIHPYIQRTLQTLSKCANYIVDSRKAPINPFMRIDSAYTHATATRVSIVMTIDDSL
eukprot:GHVU01011996.1.p1 GENE.GHVU01011996.1~~GHVU01011996.1.p1  ORF type:complete len:105 (-),score=13.57 GHVU01011996.1:98-412(-)